MVTEPVTVGSQTLDFFHQLDGSPDLIVCDAHSGMLKANRAGLGRSAAGKGMRSDRILWQLRQQTYGLPQTIQALESKLALREDQRPEVPPPQPRAHEPPVLTRCCSDAWPSA